MPRTRDGELITWKEFMKRWKQGIEGVSVLQQTKSQLTSTRIILVGIVAGLVITLMAAKTLWWLAIILFGALFNTLVQYLGVWQKKQMLQRLEEGNL